MWNTNLSTSEILPKPDRYRRLVDESRALINPEEPVLTGLANTAALLFAQLEDLNWAGFYLYDGSQLVLGPFCGKPACTVIAMGNGVCGTAAAEKQTIRVPDVDAFPGHIACDAASRSEIVIPLVSRKGMLYGVLDLDSPSLNRFDEADQLGLEHVAAVVVNLLEARTAGRDLRSMLI